MNSAPEQVSQVYNSVVQSGKGRLAAQKDPRNQAAYPLNEAARYIRLPPATLRAWTLGRPYPTAQGSGHFRPIIRPASSRPPLLSFASGQLAMRQVMQAHLKRVNWDAEQFPVRLHPFISSVPADAAPAAMPIAIDPRISFGRPVVVSRGISTAAIADRIDAGETVEALAADYDLSTAEIEHAVLYERAA